MLRTKRGRKEEGASFEDVEGGSVGGEELMTMSALASLTNDSLNGSNVDPKLLDDLRDLLPLLELLLDQDRKASSGFIRNGKIVYTKTPRKDSLLKKYSWILKGLIVSCYVLFTIEANDRTGSGMSELGPTRGHSILGESDREDDGANNSSTLTQQAIEVEKDQEEISLNNQLRELRQKLLEKEE